MLARQAHACSTCTDARQNQQAHWNAVNALQVPKNNFDGLYLQDQPILTSSIYYCGCYLVKHYLLRRIHIFSFRRRIKLLVGSGMPVDCIDDFVDRSLDYGSLLQIVILL